MNQLPKNSLRMYDVTLVTSNLIGLWNKLTFDLNLQLKFAPEPNPKGY